MARVAARVRGWGLKKKCFKVYVNASSSLILLLSLICNERVRRIFRERYSMLTRRPCAYEDPTAAMP
jgi:hypothetical protein